MKKLMLILLAIVMLVCSCAALDNNDKHKPIYMTNELYAHYAQGNFNEPAPWPY